VSGERLVEKWQEKNSAWHFEGSTKNLEKLVKDLGYRSDAFGSVIENFLSDNPGAQDAVAEWLDRNDEWAELIRAEVGEDEEPEEEEDEG
jgi:hypothetical protein